MHNQLWILTIITNKYILALLSYERSGLKVKLLYVYVKSLLLIRGNFS